MIRILSLIFIYFIINSILVFGQKNNDLYPRFGVSAHGFLNIHSASFAALPNIPNCCPQFERGYGFGPGIGVLFETPLSKSWLFGSRLIYGELGAHLLADEPVEVLVNGALQHGIFQHSLDSRFASVAAEQSLILNPTGHLFFIAGLSTELIVSDAFRQKEIILSPDDGVFADTRSRSRNEYSGNIPAINHLQAAAVFGLSYDLPLNSRHSTFISPEIIFKIAFTNISAGVPSWKSNALRLGLSLKFALESPLNSEILQEKIHDKPAAPVDAENIDSIKVRPEITQNDTVKFTNILSSGKYDNIPSVIRIKEVILKQIYPILNYIFFNENSAEIPERYHQITADSAQSFDTRYLYGTSPLSAYYEILNVIGARMSAQTSSLLTITGCNADIGEEKGDLTLSASRAAAVRRYLAEFWGIDSARIITNRRNKPEKPTLGTGEYAALAAAENRRVELVGNTDALFAPIVYERYDYIPITPAINLGIRDSSTNIDILANGKILRSFTTNSSITNWNIASESVEVLKDISVCDSLMVRAKNTSGNIIEYFIPVEIVRASENRLYNSCKIDDYHLILFDFNTAELNDANKAAAAIIRKNISDNSKVVIRGYTDIIGGKIYNKKLSEMRARNIAAEIGVGDADIYGVDGDFLYSNDLPEHRFYNRTVNITVEMPDLQK